MRRILMFLMFFVFLLLVIIVVLQLPPVGDPHVPPYAGYLPPDVPVEEITKQSNAVGLYYNRGAIKDCGSPSAITAMILDYRGYDTLYETTVIFLAMIAALSVLVGKRKKDFAKLSPSSNSGLMNRSPEESKEEETEPWIGVTRYTVVGTVIKKIVPFMVMYGLYVIFHGEVSPGGGFQGGVILGVSFVLYALIFSYQEGEKKMPSDILRIINALGPFMYAFVGLIGVVTGYTFLANKVIKTIPHGIEGTLFSSLPLLLIELGIGLGVGSIITHIFYGYVTERPLDTQKTEMK